MRPEEIVTALEAPAEDRRPLLWALEEDERPEELAAALAIAEQPLTRKLLVGVLGFQGRPEALEPLTRALSDPDVSVRSTAADALGKVLYAHPGLPGREAAGAAILERWPLETETGVRSALVAAMGPARHAPAWPALEAACDDADERVRTAARYAFEHYSPE